MEKENTIYFKNLKFRLQYKAQALRSIISCFSRPSTVKYKFHREYNSIL